MKKERNAQLLEDWYLCGMIHGISGRDEKARESRLEAVTALCEKWGRDPEETVHRFKSGNGNEWLSSVLPGRRISFFQVCEYLQEKELYKEYQWACAFVHGQDILSKEHPFTFYNAIYNQLSMIMSYTFKTIRLYPVPEKLEEQIKQLELDLEVLWGTTSWD